MTKITLIVMQHFHETFSQICRLGNIKPFELFHVVVAIATFENH